MHSRIRGYLPHIHVTEATYFVTFRLADSLPASVVVHWKNELGLRKSGIPDAKQVKLLDYNYQEKVQKFLDASASGRPHDRSRARLILFDIASTEM